MTIKIPDDAIAQVPLVFTDLAGHALAGNTSGVTVTVSDTTLVTAVLSTDGQSIIVTPLQTTGSGSVVYTDTNDNITATLDFTIVTPVPSTVAFNESGLVLTSNPNPPAGAPGSTVSGGASAPTVAGAGSNVATTPPAASS